MDRIVVSLKVGRRTTSVLVACALVVATCLLLAAAGCDELSPVGAGSDDPGAAPDLPAGTSPGAGDAAGVGAGAAAGAAAASAEAVEYNADTLQIDTRVPCTVCGSQGVFVRLHLPKGGADARYSDTGAPVVVSVPGGLDNKPVIGGAGVSRYFATGLGMVTVYFNLPGSGTAPYDTGGTYDQRGPVCQEALRDVLLFALGKQADADGDLISDLIPYADLDNVGVIGLSNGGNLAGVTMDRYSSQLDGLRYYVSYENPAGDEYVVTDLGGPKGTNPAYARGATVLDPVDGSVSTLDAGKLAFEVRTATPYFDLNGNGTLDLGSDYVCTYWESGGKRYYSTEIVGMLVDKGLVRFPSPKIADLPSTEAFWDERDMSRHTTAAVAAIHSLQGAILVATEKDHVQNEPGYPHIVVNYLGWSGLPFVRINPDEAYVESVLTTAGPGGRGARGAGPRTLADNPAGAAVNFSNIDSMLEPEGLVDEIFDLAAILELADRVHYDVWTADLAAVLQ